jgi:hypothetical protein
MINFSMKNNRYNYIDQQIGNCLSETFSVLQFSICNTLITFEQYFDNALTIISQYLKILSHLSFLFHIESKNKIEDI